MNYVYLKNEKGEVCYAHPQVGYVEITKEEYDIAIYELSNPPLTEEQRISQIKAKAGELILAKYSIIWQLNHPRTDLTYASDYAYIDNIRDISNEAEANGTALEDIDWGVL